MTAPNGPKASRRFPPYPDYKDSGVDWLGEIPNDWQAKRLKLVAPARISKIATKPEDCVYVGLEHVESWTGRLRLDSQPEVVDSVVSSFKAGDVLFGKLRPYLAKSASPEFDGVCTSEILPLTPTNECSQSYLMYCLLNAPFIRWLDSLTYGTKMPRVSPEQVGDSFVPVPSVPEQRAIVSFLDRETAKIDALIAKNRRLVELKRDKRNALIAEAVTKGLNPRVRLVPSENAIFPLLPDGWKVVKLRRLLRRVLRPVDVNPDEVYQEIGVRSWGKGVFHKEPLAGAQLEGKRVFHVRPGDLVFNIVFAWEGAVAVLTERESGMIGSHRFPTFRHDDEQIDLDYLLMILQTDHGRTLMGLNSPGAAGRNKTLRIGSFLNEEIPVPPLSLQREINARFREEESRLAAVISKSELLVDKLKELREALIAAAVTGKIDVREEAA